MRLSWSPWVAERYWTFDTESWSLAIRVYPCAPSFVKSICLWAHSFWSLSVFNHHIFRDHMTHTSLKTLIVAWWPGEYGRGISRVAKFFELPALCSSHGVPVVQWSSGECCWTRGIASGTQTQTWPWKIPSFNLQEVNGSVHIYIYIYVYIYIYIYIVYMYIYIYIIYIYISLYIYVIYL